VDLLRAYARYALQLEIAPSRESILQTLADAPVCARALWEYFRARFDPDLPLDRDEREKKLLPEWAEKFESGLDAVTSVAQDRLLRALFAIVQATVRTSYFLPASEPAEPLPIALKVEGAKLPGAAAGQALYETYVHALHVEGIHLRAAKVARGGIRHSERPDDYRREIRALMATQNVKNAVIVPSGAKGGFIVRQRRFGTAADVTAAYTTFIESLLDVTDNVVRGRVDTPARIVAYDGPDPYLVVAADKGTAGFSDLANEIAVRRKFWLGDAFASGGRHGYDHKKQGITAKGAWECVRQHFREMERDLDSETIRTIGIGDMSGDVFGNGMLLSRRLLLVAAFDHRHVFLDPDPDPETSYAERARLFQMPNSSWADYRAEALSPGGGVYPRQAKRIEPSPQACALLGLEPRAYTSEELVQAVLRAKADLLWNGGIGTYVKASDEPHAAAGDPGNDPVRVDARELRVAVVGEGGNLGFTQRGRIEFALLGGRINTDAVDNSGGVDMSDHEVNLKICLQPLVESGQLSFEERNRLLAQVEPWEIEQVLAHNRRQALLLGVDQYRSRTRVHEFRDLITQLESEGVLDRRAEHLPDRDALRARRAVFLGLTRPELALLVAHTKRALQHTLLASRLPDDPFYESYLRAYFPLEVNDRFGLAVRSHLLRREIIAVELANLVVDRCGVTFVHRIARDTGASTVQVLRAASLLGSLFDWDDLWQRALGARSLRWEAQRDAILVFEEGLERATRWYLETQPAEVSAEEMSRAIDQAVRPLLEQVPAIFPAAARARFEREVGEWVGRGLDAAVARKLMIVERAAELLDIAECAAGLEAEGALVGQAYYSVGERLELDWLRENIRSLPAEDRWERRARYEVLRDLDAAQRELTKQVLACAQAGERVEQCILRFADLQRDGLEAFAALIRDLQAGRKLTLAAAVVAARELARLAQRAQAS
jgi:glutamate dehydrogenase